jgi:hypothetical protein
MGIVGVTRYTMFLQFLSEFACGNRWMLIQCSRLASPRSKSLSASGQPSETT